MSNFWITVIVLLIIAIIVIVVLARLYRKATREISLIRTLAESIRKVTRRGGDDG